MQTSSSCDPEGQGYDRSITEHEDFAAAYKRLEDVPDEMLPGQPVPNLELHAVRQTVIFEQIARDVHDVRGIVRALAWAVFVSILLGVLALAATVAR
ncbi:MAG: hypothetical protein QOH79_3839 [Acidimicrobiaceae bacterium]